MNKENWATLAFLAVWFLLGAFIPQPEARGAQVLWLIISGIIGAATFSGKKKIMPAAWGTLGLIIAAAGLWITFAHH